MHRGPAQARRLGIEFSPDRGVGLGQGVDAGDERPVVEHRAADDERRFLPLENGLDCRKRVVPPAAGRIALVGVDEVDEVMRHPRAQRRAGLGGADVHAAIHQRRVHGHDLERQAPGELERERGLAARRRPEQRERPAHD
jgi:hypothetical protein